MERQIQLAIDKIISWCASRDFLFSIKKKTKAVPFRRRKRRMGLCVSSPELILYGSSITTESQARFLGLIFYDRLTYLPYILDLKARFHRCLGLLRHFTSTTWGADRRILLQLFTALVLSKWIM